MAVLFQIIGTVVACLSCFNIGLLFTWPSSTLKIFASTNTTLDRPMTEIELYLLGSLSSLAPLISTPVIAYLLDVIGRKNVIVIASMLPVIGWTTIAVCNIVEVILAATFIAGFSGAAIMVAPVFIGEICQESIRGTMAALAMMFYSAGSLASYVIGDLDYKVGVYLNLTFAIIGLVANLAILKESPMYLMKKGDEKETANAIAYYRRVKPDSQEVLKELVLLRRAFNPDQFELTDLSVEEEKLNPKIVGLPQKKPSLWKVFKSSRSTRRELFVCVFMISSIFQGLAALQVYAETIFIMVVPTMSVTVSSVIMAVLTIVFGVIGGFLADGIGRKPLMIFSSALTGLSCILIGTQLQLQWAPHWMSAIIIHIFTIGYTLGAGTVPYVLISEVFLPDVKSVMSMIVIQWGWLCNFIVLFIFNPLMTSIGLGPIFYVFACVCFTSSVFAMLFQPETKGLPVDAIQLIFSGQK